MKNTDMYITIADRFVLGKNIGEGSFGTVHIGYDNKSKKKVAVKLEHKNTKIPLLKHEYNVYRTIQDKCSSPKLYGFYEEDEYSILIIELMTLLPQVNDKYMPMNVKKLAVDLIGQLKIFHDANLVFCDVKPQNIVINSKGKYCLIDYGLCRPVSTNEKKIVGTAKFMSINGHIGTISYKDDLESLGYVMIYLIKGKLPWCDVKYDSKKDMLEKVYSIKVNTTIETLCSGMPEQVLRFFSHIHSIEEDEKINYKYLMRCLSS